MTGAMVVLGALCLYFLLRPSHPLGERTYWYDLSEKKLFVAAADLTPPQDGVGGTPGDAYPAVVISWSESGDDQREVAYLTSYSDELRELHAQGRDAKATGQPPPEKLGDRLWISANTLVRSPSEEHWHPKSSPSGLKVIGILTRRGANGAFPRICSPED
jgi:hypothetical protein